MPKRVLLESVNEIKIWRRREKKRRMIDTNEFMAPFSHSDESLVIKCGNVSAYFIDI